VGKRAHDQFGGARNTSSGMHQTYIHRPRDNKVTNLSDIYHDRLQDDKQHVPYQRIATGAHVAKQRHCSGGGSTAWAPTNDCTALRSGLPTWGYLGLHVTLHYHGISSARS
jgi:hypothetical protein